jgi:hypothetical protein
MRDASAWMFKPSLAFYPANSGLPPKKKRLVGKGPLVRSMVERARAKMSSGGGAAPAADDGVKDMLAQVHGLVALRTAHKRNKADQAAAAAVAAVDAASPGAMKAMKSGRRGAMTAMRAMKTMKAKKVVFETLAPWRGIPKVMAKDGKPVDYGGGRIYLSRACFRVIRRVPDYATERQMQIAKFPSIQQAWLHALKAIKDYK